ncbi:MAG TPA: hypothetical protein VKA86_01985 [Candidatus Krumholzibacteria bacterium]|nr:hypothetical protein [Candidatus Krumholzibacteria bacterium]
MNRNRSEREIAEGLGGDEARPTGDGPADAWAERVDDLVRASDDREHGEDDVAAELDRKAVVDRIRVRRHRDRLPWWRIAAPLAVAAGLAGLFFLHEVEPPADPNVGDPGTTGEALRAPEVRRMAPPRSVDEATSIDPVTREVESLLERLGTPSRPSSVTGAVRDSLVERLRTLRPRLDDPRLVRRVDAWIAPTE